MHFLSKQPICKGMLQQRFNLYFSQVFSFSLKYKIPVGFPCREIILETTHVYSLIDVSIGCLLGISYWLSPTCTFAHRSNWAIALKSYWLPKSEQHNSSSDFNSKQSQLSSSASKLPVIFKIQPQRKPQAK